MMPIRLIAALFALLTLTAVAAAQATQTADPAGPEPGGPAVVDLSVYLGSIAGIAVATWVAVSIVKRAVGRVKGLRAIPTSAYVIAIAALLALLAAWLGYQDAPTTPQEWVTYLLTVVITAATASGARELLHRAGSTPAQHARRYAPPRTRLPAVLLAAGLGVCLTGGCAAFTVGDLSDTQRYELASDAFAAAVHRLADYRARGWLTDDQVAAADALIAAMDAELDTAHDTLATGGELDRSHWHGVVVRGVDQLTRLVMRIEHERHPDGVDDLGRGDGDRLRGGGPDQAGPGRRAGPDARRARPREAAAGRRGATLAGRRLAA